MMKIRLIGLLLLSATAQAREQQIQCPIRYPTQDVRLADVPKGWDGVGTVRAGSLLEGAGLIDGPEEGRAEMIGSGAIKTKEGFETRFVVSAGEKRFFCSYGGGVELFHRIAVEATHCVIKTKRHKVSVARDIKIVCK